MALQGLLTGKSKKSFGYDSKLPFQNENLENNKLEVEVVGFLLDFWWSCLDRELGLQTSLSRHMLHALPQGGSDQCVKTFIVCYLGVILWLPLATGWNWGETIAFPRAKPFYFNITKHYLIHNGLWQLAWAKFRSKRIAQLKAQNEWSRQGRLGATQTQKQKRSHLKVPASPLAQACETAQPFSTAAAKQARKWPPVSRLFVWEVNKPTNINLVGRDSFQSHSCNILHSPRPFWPWPPSTAESWESQLLPGNGATTVNQLSMKSPMSFGLKWFWNQGCHSFSVSSNIPCTSFNLLKVKGEKSSLIFANVWSHVWSCFATRSVPWLHPNFLKPLLTSREA